MGASVTNQPLVTICIPVYYSGPDVPRVLQALVDSVNTQTYGNMIVCAAVQASEDVEGNKAVMATLATLTKETHCIGNGNPGPANNTNAAVGLALNEGYIKIMNQDDFFDSPTTISEMIEAIEASESDWLINSCIHTDSVGDRRERLHNPFWPGEKGMVEGVNRFGCPSVSMFKTKMKPECDSNLALCMDCDMWIQLYRKAGAPVIRNVPDVVVRGWEGQLSNNIDYARSLETDKIYLRQKYGYT